MKDLLAPLLPELLNILGVLVAGLIGLAAKKLSDLLKAKVDNQLLEGALLRLNEAVGSAVLEVEQTVVKVLKEALADGALSEEEKARVKAAAVDKAKALLGEKGLDQILKVLGLKSPDELLAAKVEAAVASLRSLPKV